MDKINMINYQRYVLKTKFGKYREQPFYNKKLLKITLVFLILFLASVFLLRYFSNTDSQAKLGYTSGSFLSLGSFDYPKKELFFSPLSYRRLS